MIYLFKTYRRYLFKVGYTQRKIDTRLSELKSRKGFKHSTIQVWNIPNATETELKALEGFIHYKLETKYNAKIIGNDYFIKKISIKKLETIINNLVDEWQKTK